MDWRLGIGDLNELLIPNSESPISNSPISNLQLTYLCADLRLGLSHVVMHSRYLVLFALLCLAGCQSTTTTPVSTTTTPGSTTTPASTTTPVSTTTTTPTLDPLVWVTYAVSDLSADTTLFAKPKQVGVLTDAGLIEASGLAPSKQNPGYLWTEEDSGNPNQIQLLDGTGKIVARYTLTGFPNQDWEDIAVGPGPEPGKSYVYLAEIGDNKLRYPTKTIYRFPEPTLAGKSLPVSENITAPDVISLSLPDGPKNAEAILVDQVTLDLYILSKEDRSVLYKATYPQSLTQTTVMQRLLAMPFDQVTSAGISPDNREILIRTYGQVFRYLRQAGESVVDALKRAPRLIPIANEPQGEAIGWAADGSGYYTTSEKPDATPQAIYFYKRK